MADSHRPSDRAEGRTSPSVTVLADDSTWIESEAVRQLERTAALRGMTSVVGLPDLHPGKGTPIGAAFFATDRLYPYLVGNDIGCGMALHLLDVPARRLKPDKAAKRLSTGAVEGPWDGDARARLDAAGLDQPAPEEATHDSALGTIGSGNHFAELLALDGIQDEDALRAAGIGPGAALLLVHSGSRGLGESILRRHVDRHGAEGLDAGSDEASDYLLRHDRAVRWAEVNRDVIAERVLETVRCGGRRLLDLTHNAVVPARFGGRDGWLHRKGAAPAGPGLVPIPGSRGDFTHLVLPRGDGERNLASLAHGAGRKWARSQARGRLEGRHSLADMRRTKLGSRVLCDDRELLYEEAPQAYKPVASVIDALVGAGVATPVARLRPLLTYKTVRS